MNENQSYEKLIRLRTEGKLLLAKIGLIAAYVLFAIVGVLLAVLLADGHPALIVLVALLDFCLWLMTHKLVKLEYEYTFVSGSFYLSKILGKSARRELFEEELSRAVKVAPYVGEYKEAALRQEITKTFSAISSRKAQNIWFMLFEGDGGRRTLILFEADERSLKYIRHCVPRAVAHERLTIIQENTEDN